MVASLTVTYVAWSAVIPVCAALDAVYCGLESGIYRLNKIRLDLQADRGRPAAVALQKLMGDFNHLLAVLLIGTNLARFTITFAVSALFVTAGLADKAEWLTLAIVTPALFVVNDSVPKSVFQRLAETLVYRLVWMLRVSSAIFSLCGLAPLVKGFSLGLLRLLGADTRGGIALGHRGIESIVAEGRASGLLTDYQSAMADRAVHLADVRLRDVMVPLAQAVAAQRNVSRDGLMSLIQRHPHSRLPLLGADGQVAGVLDVFDLLTADDNARPADLMTPPLVLSQHHSLPQALLAIQRARAVLAVVASETGQHVGIVTVKDIAEQIVGDLADRGE